jgi:uncharacterized MAPEG superfamily protein
LWSALYDDEVQQNSRAALLFHSRMVLSIIDIEAIAELRAMIFYLNMVSTVP